MRIKPFWIGLILVLCFFFLIVISAPRSGQAADAFVQATPPSAVPSSSGRGLSAIHPSSPSGVTTAEVQAYLRTHPFVGGPPIPGVTVSIKTIQFMTSKQASALMGGEETGLPDTATVCYVELRGPFTVVAPIPPGAKQLPTVASGVEIFDAQTGNLLMWWAPLVQPGTSS